MISKSDLAFAYRKGPIVPPQHAAQQQYNNASMQAQTRAETERREKMRRIAKNPTDKNIPEGVEDMCIGDGVARYRELREVERTLDATMMRKRLDVMDSKHHSRASRFGTMRIWISNTVDNQPWQSSGIDADAFDFESDSNATYRVKIQGRLLDDQGDEGLEDEEDDDDKDADAMDKDGAEAQGLKAAAKPKSFSHYFTSITIDFDRAKSLQPDNFTQIEWKRPENSTAKESIFSELEFERKGDENINVTINLQRYQNPEVGIKIRHFGYCEDPANSILGLPPKQTARRTVGYRRGRPRRRADGHMGIRTITAPAARRRRAQICLRRKAQDSVWWPGFVLLPQPAATHQATLDHFTADTAAIHNTRRQRLHLTRGRPRQDCIRADRVRRPGRARRPHATAVPRHPPPTRQHPDTARDPED